MLESIFNTTTTANITFANIAIAVVTAIVLGLVIALVHKFTTKTTANFLITVSILPTLVLTVILLVNGNLGTSLAVAGAFSLIRFRSMPGNSKEILTVFWAMATGLALGMGYVGLAAIFTVVVALLVIVISKVFEKMNNTNDRKLKVVIPENMDYTEVFDDIFEEYTDQVELLKAKTSNMGSTYDLVYNIRLKKDINEKEFTDQIRVRNSNMLVQLQREAVSGEEL